MSETAMAPSGEREEALHLFVVLARSAASVARRPALHVARHGLTPGDFAVLEALYHKGPMLLGEVQKKILVSSGGVTYLVDRLERLGLVERRSCPGDRRAKFAALTGAGAELMERVFPSHAAAIEEAVSGLTRAERRTVTRLLRKLGLAAAKLEPAEETEP